MKNRCLAGLLAVGLVFMILLAGCGGASAPTKTTGENTASTATTESESNKVDNSQANTKSNHDKLLDVLKQVKEKTGFIGTSSGLGDYLGNFMILYKKDIVHPETKATKIGGIDEEADILTKQDDVLKNVSGNLYAIVHKKLRELDIKQVSYGCNAQNKDIVMAFVFVDGLYLYDIDAQGNKVNETVFMFPDAN